MLRLRTLLRRLRRLPRAERGAAMPLIAVSIPVIMGAGAVAVDAAHLLHVRAELQATADIAARAAAWRIPDTQAASAAAIDYADANMDSGLHGSVLQASDVTPGDWNEAARTFTPDSASPNAVRVTARRAEANGNAVKLVLAPILGQTQSDVVAEAVAALLFDTEACVLALAPNGTGITISGNVSIRATQCGFAANSTDPDATVVTNGASATAELLTLYSAGGIDDGQGVISTTEPMITNTGRPLEDPYADRQQDIGTAVADAKSDPPSPPNANPMQPGHYPGNVNLHGTVDLAPGTYVFSGDVMINGGATVTGDDVTIILDNSDLSVNGNADIELSAPSNGPLSGLVLAREGADPGASSITGNGLMAFDGAIYMPDTDLDFGGTSGSMGCLQIVARAVNFHGNPDFEVNCDPLDGERIEITAVQLVS